MQLFVMRLLGKLTQPNNPGLTFSTINLMRKEKLQIYEGVELQFFQSRANIPQHPQCTLQQKEFTNTYFNLQPCTINEKRETYNY